MGRADDIVADDDYIELSVSVLDEEKPVHSEQVQLPTASRMISFILLPCTL